jgi:TonB-dependent receptor
MKGEVPVKNLFDVVATSICSLVIDGGYRVARKAIFMGGMLLFLATPALMATGTVKGKILDKDTKDALPGATILIKGTSVGAAADLNGVFSIPNAPSGEQTLVVSYIGYVSTEVNLNIPEGGILQQDVSLQATTIQGKEVIVTAQAQGQMQAINQQLSSDRIANIVSEARIQELPDFNAAQAIGRLPGVSTLESSGEANKVVIRGLAPQFNRVAVGGISLASTGSTQMGATSLGITAGDITNDRSVDLTMVTPYMIKSIQVYKSLTPDMNANATGGFVNMELREAPEGLHGDALWQSGYTQKSNTYNNFRAVLSASDRFFDNQLGVYVLGDAEQYDRNADNMNASYNSQVSSVPDPTTGFRPVQVTNVVLQRHVETRKRYGGNVIFDYKLGSGSLKSVNMFSRLNSNSDDYRSVFNYDAKQIQFSYGNSNINTDLAVNTLEYADDFGFMSTNLKIANTYSRNNRPNSPYYTFSQDQSYGQVPYNTVPEVLAETYKGLYTTSDNTQLNSTSLFSADYKENDQVYKGDFKFPFTVNPAISGYFKVGGEFRHNYITNDQATPYLQIGGDPTQSNINSQIVQAILAQYPNLKLNAGNRFTGTDFITTDSKLLSSFLSNKFGSMTWATDPSVLNWAINKIRTTPAFYATSSLGGWFDGAYQNLPNDYWYKEDYAAGYAMSELDFGPDLLVVGGIRLENDKSTYFAYNMVDARNPNPAAQKYFDTTVTPSNQYWLPMVQARYKINDWSDIRYSYAQTLARPAYTQLSPHFNIDVYYTSVYAGNPHLKPAQAYNHDVQLTFHSNDLGLLSIGGFYKTFKDFAYATQYRIYSDPRLALPGYDSVGTYRLPNGVQPNDGALLNTFINSPYEAYVKGVEFDLQTRFWYLPAPLDGIVLGLNYTHMASSTTYPLTFLTRTVVDSIVGRRTYSHQAVIDSSRGGRLLYQPNDIFNASVGYDYLGFSARLSFVFQGNSVTSIGTISENDGFSKNYFRMDFSARQNLPWNGLQVYLDVYNLNNESNISTQPTIGGFTSQQYYGLTADLGLRFTL